jgi:hypothetical protein
MSITVRWLEDRELVLDDPVRACICFVLLALKMKALWRMGMPSEWCQGLG